MPLASGSGPSVDNMKRDETLLYVLSALLGWSEMEVTNLSSMISSPFWFFPTRSVGGSAPLLSPPPIFLPLIFLSQQNTSMVQRCRNG